MSESVVLDAHTRSVVTAELLDNLFVEAGAGTGKTTLLVSRVLALVDEGRSLRSIAAITFTEKAAAELRDRLRAALAQRGRRDLLDELDDATITTIHGFARSILALHAMRAGLPVELEMVVDVEAAARFADEYARFADRLLSGDVRPESMRRAVALGLNRRNLESVVFALHTDRHRLDAWPGEIPPLPSIDITPVVAALDAALSARHACIGRDKLAEFIEAEPLALRGALVRLDDDPVEQLRLLAFTPVVPRTNIGRKDQWPPPFDKETVVGLLRAADQARRAVVEANVAHVLAVLVAEIRSFVDDYAERRLRAGRLEFHDLLVEARRLVRDDPAVRSRLGEQYQHILVDEFQDTDPLQLDLITLIASIDEDAGTRPWRERTLALGALFAVGDPKQSIYRFRAADVSLYAAAAEAFGGSPLPLTVNFRTTADVLGWVNPTIEQLFARSGDSQAPFQALDGHRPQQGWGVQVLGVDALDMSADEVRTVAARELADAVVAMVASARPVHAHDGAPRPVRFADIAILLPTRTNLGALEVALAAAGVPYRVESRSLVFSTDEVRTLASVLRAIDDPGDEVAVVAALRSTAFACTDGELVTWKQAGGRWNALTPCPDTIDGDHAVARAMAWVADLHHRRHWYSVPELVDVVVSERHLVEAALAHRRPRDHWRRLEIVAEQALAYDRVGGRSLRAFVNWMDAQRLGGASDNESVTPDLDDDAVRVMTVHAAKGLEFPIVVMAGLSGEPPTFPPAVLWGDDGRPVLRIGSKDEGMRSIDFDSSLDLDRALDRAEADRLLYVAATRARDGLVVCLHRPTKGEFSHAHRLHAVLSAADSWRTFEAPPAATVVADDPLGQSTLPFLPDRAAWRTRRAVAVANGERSTFVSATAVSDLRPGPDGTEEADEADEVRPPWRRGRAGTSIGRAVHAVLQTVALDGDGVEHGAWLQAQAEGISDHADEVARLVRAVLASPPLADARAGRSWRELYVAAPVGDVVIEGFIDLLVERPDGTLLVVDYKTDSASSQADIDDAVARYRLQVAAYALAVGQQLGHTVDAAALVFARARGEAATVELVDLPGAVAEVRARCGS